MFQFNITKHQLGRLKPHSVTSATAKTYEHADATHSNSHSSSNGNDPDDADLREVIEAWPELPEAVRADIVAMVRAVETKR